MLHAHSAFEFLRYRDTNDYVVEVDAGKEDPVQVAKDLKVVIAGIKGVGEIGQVPTAPAVAAALHELDGEWRSVLPMRRGTTSGDD